MRPGKNVLGQRRAVAGAALHHIGGDAFGNLPMFLGLERIHGPVARGAGIAEEVMNDGRKRRVENDRLTVRLPARTRRNGGQAIQLAGQRLQLVRTGCD